MLYTHNLPYGATLFMEDGAEVRKGDLVCEWDPYNAVIISEYEGRVAIREINTSEYPELVPYFRIAAVPTQILFDKDGKELGWHQGYMDESSMRQAIEGALKAAEAKPDEAKAAK